MLRTSLLWDWIPAFAGNACARGTLPEVGGVSAGEGGSVRSTRSRRRPGSSLGWREVAGFGFVGGAGEDESCASHASFVGLDPGLRRERVAWPRFQRLAPREFWGAFFDEVGDAFLEVFGAEGGGHVGVGGVDGVSQ